jgi:hypothetical protein
MKRISNKEALNYVPYEKNIFLPPPSYFSIFEDLDGWEEIRYYTSHLKHPINNSSESHENTLD